MFTRRAILHRCLALGSLSVASSFSAEAMFAAFQDRETHPRKPTELSRPILQKAGAHNRDTACAGRSRTAFVPFGSGARYSW